jgi:hypothetical protein
MLSKQTRIIGCGHTAAVGGNGRGGGKKEMEGNTLVRIRKADWSMMW